MNNTSRVEVLSVRFARPDGQGWTFDGQPDITPAAAVATLAPAFADSRPRGASPDTLVQHIAENVMLNGETIRLDGATRLAPK